MQTTSRNLLGSVTAIVLMAVLLCCVRPSFAAGTPAGTRISNSATLTYSLNGTAAAPAVAVAPQVVVGKVISVVVTWQDSAAVPTASPEAAKPLSFLVTNTGNG